MPGLDEGRRMDVPNILLLSGSVPGCPGVGGVILGDLCRLYPRGRISCFAVVPADRVAGQVARRDPLPTRIRSAPHQREPVSRFGPLGRLVAWWMKRRRVRRCIQGLLREAADFARTQGVTQIWSVLDCPTTVEMTAPLAAALRVPLVSLVWDDFRDVCERSNLWDLSRRLLGRQFGAALRASERCAVICENMKRRYEQEYGTRGVVLQHGVRSALVCPPAARPGTSGPFRIGYAGSVTAARTFESLLTALASSRWRIAGRPVRLTLMGRRFEVSSRGTPAHVTYLGWRSHEECIRRLSETDVTYLPQPFDPRFQPRATLSFPTKLTTYLAAGRPILVHSPPGSSLAAFFKQHPVGVWCSELDQGAVLQALTRLLTEDEIYARATDAGRAALERQFTEGIFRRAFAQFVGVDENHLTTP